MAADVIVQAWCTASGGFESIHPTSRDVGWMRRRGMLQSRDVFVALSLHVLADPARSFESLESVVGLSASTLHRSVNRLRAAGLVTREHYARGAALADRLVAELVREL